MTRFGKQTHPGRPKHDDDKERQRQIMDINVRHDIPRSIAQGITRQSARRSKMDGAPAKKEAPTQNPESKPKFAPNPPRRGRGRIV
jgi:hypothetical protein